MAAGRLRGITAWTVAAKAVAVSRLAAYRPACGGSSSSRGHGSGSGCSGGELDVRGMVAVTGVGEYKQTSRQAHRHKQANSGPGVHGAGPMRAAHKQQQEAAVGREADRELMESCGGRPQGRRRWGARALKRTKWRGMPGQAGSGAGPSQGTVSAMTGVVLGCCGQVLHGRPTLRVKVRCVQQGQRALATCHGST